MQLLGAASAKAAQGAKPPGRARAGQGADEEESSSDEEEVGQSMVSAAKPAMTWYYDIVGCWSPLCSAQSQKLIITPGHAHVGGQV